MVPAPSLALAPTRPNRRVVAGATQLNRKQRASYAAADDDEVTLDAVQGGDTR